MVFDREGDGAGFFSGLVRDEIAFVTWEKNADARKLASLKEEEFTDEFEFNGKKYGWVREKNHFTMFRKTPQQESPDQSNEHRLP